MQNDQHDLFEIIRSGELVTIENTQNAELPISIQMTDGSRLEIGLAPRQMIEYLAGDSDARIVLHSGDPAALLIVKPESAS